MTDPNPQSDQNATPEDVATLYSWANLHGAKYRDFSAARAQTREKARLRAEQEQAGEQQQSQEAPETAQSAEATDAAEAGWTAEEARLEEAQLEEARLAAEKAQIEQAQWQQDQLLQAQLKEQAHQAELAAEMAARQAEKAAQQAAELEAHRAAQEAAEQAAQRAAEQLAQRAAEQLARLEAEQAARQAAEALQALSERAEQQAAEQAARRAQELGQERAQEQADERAREQAQERAQQRAQEHAAQLAAAQQAADRAAEQVAFEAEQQRIWQQPRTDRFAAPPAVAHPDVPPQQQSFAAYTQPPAYRPSLGQRLGQPQQAPEQDGPTRDDRIRDDKPQQESSMPRNSWATPDLREPAGRPAWLNTETQETATPSVPHAAVTPAPEDTLQGSRDRLTSRWFALRGVFDGNPVQAEAAPAPVVSRAPAMAVFSLAGGVGKTSLVATLGRALSARGERVLLVDTAAFGLLPFFFGATDQRPGLLRTFSPPGMSSDAPIQMVTIDPDGLGSETPESLSGEISKFARGASRVIVDLATASGATTRRIMRMSPLVLVPVIPDMNSVVSVSSIDAFFEHNSNPAGQPTMPYYVLNQFDATLPLHLDVREVLREQLGERLLPFALRRAPAMSEALAEGMTVMDYAPSSTLADDFVALAGWVKGLSAPAMTSYRGVRWSER